MFGSAFGGRNRKKTASLLFEHVSKQMIKDGIFSFAICKYAYDKEIIESFIFNGFGIRCSDAIKKLTNLDEAPINSGCRYEEVSYEKSSDLLDLINGLSKHMNGSPIYMPTSYLTVDEFSVKCAERKNRFFVAYNDNRPVGYIEVCEKAETFISEDEEVLNICGTYVDEQYRNNSVAQELLLFTMKKLSDEGLK